MRLASKFRVILVSIAYSVILIACSEERKHPKHEIAYTTQHAIQFSDTSKSYFSQLKIKDTARSKTIAQKTYKFYANYGFESRWLYEEEPSALANSFLRELSIAEDYGLKPSTYNYNELRVRLEQLFSNDTPNKEEILALDKELTAAFLLFTTHLQEGRIHPHSIQKGIWKMDLHEEDESEIRMLLGIDDKRDLHEVLDTIHPQHDYYVRLRNELKKLNGKEDRDIKQFSIENLSDFKIGYTAEVVGKIRHNLNQWDVPVSLDSNMNTVDQNLIDAIELFQKLRNIKVDGLPGRNTLVYLNMSNEELKDLIALNLERMRLLPEEFGENYILVNVPEFILRVYKKEEVKLKMRVIVGKQYNPTPIFSDTLKYLVFRPTWTVPQSIIHKEMMPKLMGNPYHYSAKFKIYENGEEIDPGDIDWSASSTQSRYFNFVQNPGPANALGLVKFIMPNDMSIYLHDTPNHTLFSEEERALSHGCIRLQNPAELATYLLKDVAGWDAEKVEKSMMEGDEPRNVRLQTNYHVQIAYFTTWVNENNELKIAEDIYGHDEVQLAQMKALY